MSKNEHDRKGDERDGGSGGGSITGAFWVVIRSLTFILSEMEFHWSALSRAVTCSNF